MNWIDTHSHINISEFDSDRDQVIQRSINAGVSKIILPNIEVSTITSMKSAKMNYSDTVELMMGLHPCSVNADYMNDLEVLKNELYQGDYKAVGEIGLDLYWDKTTLEIQKDAFTQQLKWSHDLGLPVSVHSREATQECIDCIHELGLEIKGVFHCFSGSIEQAYEVINLGMYLGIGGVVSYKKSNLPEIISKVGLSRLVLETDAPYLSPVPYRGKRNEPSYIPIIGQVASEILVCDIKKVAEETTNNAIKVFSL